MESMASSTQPTVPSPPHTNTRTLPGGSRVQSCRALEGVSWDRSNTCRRERAVDEGWASSSSLQSHGLRR